MAVELIQELARDVFRDIGAGYSEKVYHKALEVACDCSQIRYESEKIIPVCYKGFQVGCVRADLCLRFESDIVVIELKATAGLKSQDVLQLRKYMQLTKTSLGMLINFPPDESKTVEFSVIQCPY